MKELYDSDASRDRLILESVVVEPPGKVHWFYPLIIGPAFGRCGTWLEADE